MIAKKQKKNFQYTKSRAQDVADLCHYINNARSHISDRLTSSAEPEKVICSGSFNFNFSNPDAQISEMSALAAKARSGNPIDHWIVAWPYDEQPTETQLHEAANIFIKEIGLEKHQCIYGAHGNTDSIHIHFAINRVSLETEKVVKINKGFDRLAAQKAITVIAYKQGWRQVEGIKYEMTPAGPQLKQHSPRGLSDAARAAEIATATESLERRARALAPEIAAATSWQDLHQRLAAHGCTYEKRKGGAVIKFGKSGFIKASKASREASLAALEKRFGAPFQRPIKLAPKPYDPAPPKLRRDLDPISLILALIFHLLGLHKAARALLHTQQELERAELRAAKFSSAQARWAAQSVLREEHTAARRTLKAAQDAELAAIKNMTPEQAKTFCEKNNLFPNKPTPTPEAALAGQGGETSQKKETQMDERERKVEELFEVVHAALGADRYRITAKDENTPAGEQPKHFTYGKWFSGPDERTETGAFRGWLAWEVIEHMPEVVKMTERGRFGTYITPLSKDTHYVLIDDINTPEKLEKSQKYGAALVIESSPGNRQAVLKIRAEADPQLAKKAANACAARINAECGDPAVRNGEQAWRMPGLVNNKPKHRGPDGSAPEVVLLESKGGFCPAAQHIYNEEIARLREVQQLQQPAQQQQEREVPVVRGAIPQRDMAPVGISWANLYGIHGVHISEKVQGITGRQLDYAVACRLRGMGYSDGEAIRILAHGREWNKEVRHGDTAPQSWEQELLRAQAVVRAAYYTHSGDRDTSRLGDNAIKAAKRWERDCAKDLKEEAAQAPAAQEKKPEPEQTAKPRRRRGRSR